MVDTRLVELKKDQQMTQVVVNGLVDRLEAVMVQIKELQDQATKKWDGVQLQLAAISKATLVQGGGEGSTEQVAAWSGATPHRMLTETKPIREDRGNFLPKLEFPDFDGSNLEDWVYKSERYFELEQITDSTRVRIASVYMFGKALQWHYTFIRNRGRVEGPTWAEYGEVLTRRFGKALFVDPMGRLKNLRQEGTNDNLYMYMEEFDSCLRKVLERVDLPEEFQISLFINGLKEEYRRTLWLLKPTRLLDSQSNARLLSTDVPSEPMSGGIAAGLNNQKTLSRGLIPFTSTRVQANVVRKRLSQEEVNERRNKGLRFECNEPYFRDHRCPRRRLYSMVVEYEEVEGIEGDKVNHYVEEEEDLTPRVTLHAINGESGSNVMQTMRLIGMFKKRTIHILVDSGITHNFLDAKVAKNLLLTLLTIDPIPIMVADGRKIQSTKAVRKFSWQMQGYGFEADFYVIPLKGCEVVLGVKWLAQLGDVTWNF